MRKINIYRRIAFIASIALLILLAGFVLLPLTYSEADLVSQSCLQGMRAQKIAKDALTLEYRPASAHIQAISEIQNTLPAWEKEQTQLVQTHNTDIQTLLSQAQPDYVALDTAANKLLAHPDDTTQIQIILQHERNYSLIMNQVSVLIQDRIDAVNTELIVTQVVIATLIAGTVVMLFVLSKQTMPKKEVTNGQA
jgi:hypothetical protein